MLSNILSYSLSNMMSKSNILSNTLSTICVEHVLEYFVEDCAKTSCAEYVVECPVEYVVEDCVDYFIETGVDYFV